jgi:hypothetical protein
MYLQLALAWLVNPKNPIAESTSMRLRTPCFLGIACMLAYPSSGSADDQLRIEHVADGDNVVVLMDSRVSSGPTWWCSNDEVLRTTENLAVGKRDAARGCNTEIAVFASGNAMALSFPGWTDSDGDIHTITMKPIIDAAVSIWIADAAAEVRAPLDIANATWIYAQNKVGVQFVPTYHLVDSDPNAVATIGTSCDSIGWIRRSEWYMPHALNIYYVKNITLPPELASPGLQDTPGLTCDRFGDGSIKGDANIIFVGGSANLATLAHEIGHAFGLRPGTQGGHTNGLKGFDSNNVMAGGGSSTRSHFSLGQAFRMNTQADEWGGTMLIANGLRPGPGRACPPLATSDMCPPLALDWSRP